MPVRKSFLKTKSLHIKLLFFNEHSLNKKVKLFLQKFVKVLVIESLTKSAVRNAMLNPLEINTLFSGKSSQLTGRKVTEKR